MPPVTPEEVGEEHGVVPDELGGEALIWPDTSDELNGEIGTGGPVGVVVVVVLLSGDDGELVVLGALVLPLPGTCGLEMLGEDSIDLLARFEDCAFTEFFKGLGLFKGLNVQNKSGPHGRVVLITLLQALCRELFLLTSSSSFSSSALKAFLILVGTKSSRVIDLGARRRDLISK